MGTGLLCRKFLCWAWWAAQPSEGDTGVQGSHSQHAPHRTGNACHITGVGPVGFTPRHPPRRAWFGVHMLVPF